MAYTGLRTVEAHRADVEDFRTKDGRLVLSIQGTGRTEKGEFVLLREPVLESLRQWPAMGPGDPDKGPLFVSLPRRNLGERMSRGALRSTDCLLSQGPTSASTGRWSEARLGTTHARPSDRLGVRNM